MSEQLELLEVTTEHIELVPRSKRKVWHTLEGKRPKGKQMNSIAQHHYAEIFLKNGRVGGVFHGTNARKTIETETLRKAFVGNVLPEIVILECQEEERATEDCQDEESAIKDTGGGTGRERIGTQVESSNDDGSEDEGDGNNGVQIDDDSEVWRGGGVEAEVDDVDLGHGYKIRFYRYNEPSKSYMEVSFKSSSEIPKALVGQVMAYARSLDEHLKTTLYNDVFNAPEARNKKGKKKRGSIDPTSADEAEPPKKRYKQCIKADKFFGRYIVKERELDRIDCVLPWHAVRLYHKFVEVTMPDIRNVELGELDKTIRNGTLTRVARLPKESAEALFDPMVKDRDLGQLLCLKPGMNVKCGVGPIVKEGVIKDFARGIIYTEKVGMMGLGDITEATLDGHDHVMVELGLGGPWRRIVSMQNVVVKRNPRTTAEIIKSAARGGDVARFTSILEKGSAEIAAKAPFDIGKIRTKKRAAEMDLNDLRGEDRVYRHINRLPNYKYVEQSRVPEGFVCNVCGETIAIIKARKEKRDAIQTRVLKNCIVMDKWASEDKRFKGCSTPVECSLINHGENRHIHGITHHFASPKMPVSVWAWEMSVRYVAQVLLDQSLQKVGLDKFLFKILVESGQEGPVCGQICAILGGAISETKIEFEKKLVGVKYNGLYLPGGLRGDSMPTVEQLKKIRKSALKKVVNRAQLWIKNQLLPEMSAFNYSTMVAALMEEQEAKKTVVQKVSMTKRSRMNEKERKKQEGKKNKPGRVGPKKINSGELCAGYFWNAVGLFFRRGVFDEVYFPPAQRSLSDSKALEYTMWDALEEKFSGVDADVQEISDGENGEGEGGDDGEEEEVEDGNEE